MMLKRRNLLLVTLLVFLTFRGSASALQTNNEAVYRIVNQIRKELMRLGNYGVFDFLSFSVEPGTVGARVRLNGYASRPSLKADAERAVKRVDGVESLDNKVEELPLSPRDEEIRAATYVRIYGNSALSRYNPNRGVPIYGVRRRLEIGISNDPPLGPHPIHIIVKNGNVTLEGTVDMESDKTIAGIQANGVSGVFSVTNNLIVPSKKS